MYPCERLLPFVIFRAEMHGRPADMRQTVFVCSRGEPGRLRATQFFYLKEWHSKQDMSIVWSLSFLWQDTQAVGAVIFMLWGLWHSAQPTGSCFLWSLAAGSFWWQAAQGFCLSFLGFDMEAWQPVQMPWPLTPESWWQFTHVPSAWHWEHCANDWFRRLTSWFFIQPGTWWERCVPWHRLQSFVSWHTEQLFMSDMAVRPCIWGQESP